MTTDNITFERFERDSEANKKARRESSNPRLTYDFKVLIDGEYRALMSKEVYGKGYRIYDADHRPLHKVGEYDHHPKHLGSEIAKQAEFFQIVKDMLGADRIPTIERMAELRQQEAERKIEIARQAKQNVLDRHASAAGPVLLKAIKYLLAVVDENDPQHETVLEYEAESAAAQERHPSWERMKEDAFASARIAIQSAEDVGSSFDEVVESEIWALSR